MIEIDVKNLCFAYADENMVLKNINLRLGGDGRAVAIIGQNGAGKTTFAKLLKGLLRPVEGSIFINGRDIAGKTVAELAGIIGMVFQNPDDQIFKKNVLEEVMFGPLNIKMPPDKAKESALNALTIAGLADMKGENPHDLSLSERKLLCIASILAMDTQAVILDEPTIAQDHIGKQKIAEIIGVLKSQGKLVISIAHDMDFVSENFERTVVLNEGLLLMDANTRRVFSDVDTLREAHVEQPHITMLSTCFNFKDICLTKDEFISAKQSIDG